MLRFLSFLLASFCCSLIVTQFLLAEEPAKTATPVVPYADPPMPRFRVLDEGFEANEADIRRLLTSTGRELWRYFPDYDVEPFVIRRGKEGPIVLHQRNEQGEIVMRLDTQETYWAQYAFQFAHEFCHVLCKYDNDAQSNQWFEEAVCETASLFALRQMEKSWEHDPPYEHWKDYREHLKEYADDRMEVMPLVPVRDFSTFVAENKSAIRKDPKYLEFHRSVALALLPLLEEQPQRWESVRWLNAEPSPKDETLADYLKNWQQASPAKHQTFVMAVGQLFDVKLQPLEKE